MLDPSKRIANLPPEKLKLLLQQAARKQGQRAETPIVRQSRASHTFPLSFQQSRLWFLDQLEPNSPIYNVPEAFRIHGPIDIEVFQRALNALVERHEILRTTFTTVDGEPLQIIAKQGTIPLEKIDLRHRPATGREAEALAIITQAALQPFDLTQGPLMRATLVQIDEHEYFFLLTPHHIIYDGWSGEVLLHELNCFYESFTTGQPLHLPPLPIQYADYAVWQRQRLQGDVLQRQLSYWTQQLAGSLILQLPTDRPRPPIQTYAGAGYSAVLSRSLSADLKAFAQKQNATLFIVLLAAFNILLSRYTGQSDISVGTAIANRNRTELENLIGFFVNTLVLRTPVTGDLTFNQLIERVHAICTGAYAHQDLPFERLVECLQVERDLSRSPLFQVLFILQNVPPSASQSSQFVLQAFDFDAQTAKFDLALFMGESEQGLAIEVEYSTDLFNETTIERLLKHFQMLLEACIADPNRRIAYLPLLDQAERRQMLVEWNATDADYPYHLCLHRLFERSAERFCQTSAVIFEGHHVTYQELNQRANQLARYLQRQGVKVGDLVGLSMERSIAMLVGLFAILKVGAAYVPLDPSYPQERLHFIVKDANISLVLTQKQLAGSLPSDLHTLSFEDEWLRIGLEASENIESAVTAQHLAYVIYTSGSTGKPKGVQIPHVAVINFLSSMQQYPGISRDDRLLAVTSLSFDIAGLELFLPLLNGACLILASGETASAGERLVEELVQSHATMMQATPSTWRLLLEAGWQGSQQLKMLCGGEALPGELADRLLTKGTALWNMYGPTETTIWSTCCKLSPGEGSIGIGRPIANTQVHILDAFFEPVPIGVAGELSIGGDGLSWGYLHRPDLTAEKFIPDPFSKRAGTRLYRTGDLARYLPGGTIEYLGRLDYQVKIRGFRIELGEIEAALNQHPAVQECVVVAQEHQPGKKQLVAYIVSHQTVTLEHTTTDQQSSEQATSKAVQSAVIAELRAHLKQTLPGYMLPSYFVVLDTLPLTPNGKIDRRALPPPGEERTPDDFAPPSSATEKILARIWTQVLGIEQIGIHDNFFHCGGDSLLVIQVVTRAKQRGLHITTKQVFQHPTIASLATAVGSTVLVAEQAPITGPVPFTTSQCWFLEMNHHHQEYYNIEFLLESTEELDPVLVEKVVKDLFVRHDSLRLRFIQDACGQHLTIASPEETALFRRIDLTRLNEQAQKQAVDAIVSKLQTSFDLSQGPLFQAIFFERKPANSDAILFACHYLSADIFSWQILLADFGSAYLQLKTAGAIQLPPKTTSVKQWTERLIEHADTLISQEQSYWLAEAREQVNSLPLDFPGGENLLLSSRSVSIQFSAEEAQILLQDLPRTFQTQIDAVLLTALTLAFTRWIGSSSLIIELFGHGREPLFEDMDLSRTVGSLNTLYPMLLSAEGKTSPTAVLQAITEQLRHIPNHGMGYGILRYLSRDEDLMRRVRSLPQPEVYFNYLGVMPEVSAFTIARAFGGHYQDKHAKRQRLLEIVAVALGEGRLEMEWEYSENIHQRATIERLAHDTIDVLRALVAASGDKGNVDWGSGIKIISTDAPRSDV